MVLYFTPIGAEPGKDDWKIYMGRDKYENEDLIKYGLSHDVWFHVDDLSSAHVYLRLPLGTDMEGIPADILEDCAQLVKANSIQGNKLNNIDVVYTPHPNLKKTAAMDVGQVTFHSLKLVKKIKVPTRVNDIVNRLNRTKKELNPDLSAEKDAYDREVRSKKKAEADSQRREEKAAKELAKQEREARSYNTVMQADNMTSREAVKEQYQSFQDYEDDFM